MVPPNLDPQSFSLSATIVGALISPEFTAAESNAIGNWLVLLGDYLLTYASQLAFLQSISNNQDQTARINQLNTILQALRRMEDEVEKLKKERSD